MSDCYVGEIRMFAGADPPAEWAFCDGRRLLAVEYSALFALLVDTYGGDRKTYFMLPDLRGRVPVHAGVGQGLTRRSCGNAFGEEQVTLTEANITKHNHQILLSADAEGTTNNPKGNYLANSVEFNMYGGTGISIVTALHEKAIVSGSHKTDPHQNMMPSQCINFIIALR